MFDLLDEAKALNKTRRGFEQNEKKLFELNFVHYLNTIFAQPHNLKTKYSESRL